MSELQLLDSILSEDDLKLIPANLKVNINCFLESKFKILDVEKQRYSLLEKDYNDVKIKIDFQSDLVNRYKKHITELEEDVHNSRRELCDANHGKDCLNVELKNLRLELNLKDEEVNKLNTLIETKNEEIIKLIENNHKLQIDLEQIKKESSDSDTNGEHFRNLLDEKEKLYNLECNYYKSELERITNDYHENCSKYNQLSSEFTIYKNETEIELKDLAKENNSVKTQNTFLNSLIEKKDNQINELALKLRELNEHQELLKEQYSIEKKEHDNLINYYKKLLDDSKKTKIDLLNQIKELHSSFTESKDHQKLIQNKLNNFNALHEEEIGRRNQLIIELQNQIEELKTQLLNQNQKEVSDTMRQFYPTANTLSKMFDNNMPLPIVYTKYEELQAKYDNLINENDELRLKIQEMIAESEKNAPLIFYKTQENKKAFAEIEEYKNQLCKVSSDLENALSEIENSNKINNYLKRELTRYEKTNIDLSRQVQNLVQVVHERVGNFVSTKFLPNDEFLDKESPFDREISLNLVTFKNIEEIHNNNQKLLATIRELSEQYNELQDKYNNRNDDEESKKRIDDLLIQIESLKEENRHKHEILSELMAERESKLNSSKHDTTGIGNKDKQGTSTLFKITSRAYLEEKIAELTQKLEQKNEEFEQFKNRMNAQEDQLRTEIKNYLEKINDYQNEISKLTVKVDSLNENNKVLDSTLIRYNKDIDLLRERNAKLEEQRKTLKERIGTFESKKNELIAKLDEMKNQLDSKSNLKNVLENENSHLKLENNLVKQRVEELKKEVLDYKKELNQVKTDYQVGSIKTELELKSKIQLYEVKITNQQQTITALTNENKQLNEKSIEQQKQARISINTYKQKALNEAKEYATVRNERDSIAKQLKELQDKLREIEQSTDDSASRAKWLKIQAEYKIQLENKHKEITKLIQERKELMEKLNSKDNLIKQAKIINEQQIAQFEQEVAKRVQQVGKKLEESSLRERILKAKFEQRIKNQEKQIADLTLKLSTTEHTQQFEKDQQIASTKQEKELQPTTSKQPNTATIKPLTVLNRPQQTTLPQAAVTPTQAISNQSLINQPTTNSPQTAYVTPTSIEVSNSETPISSSPALNPMILSNISSSNQSPQASTSYQQEQIMTNITPIDSSTSSLKRQRMISFEDLNSKKPKVDLIEKNAETSVQQSTEQETMIQTEQVIDATSTSTTIDSKQEEVVETTVQQQQEPKIMETTIEISKESTTDSTKDSNSNLMVTDQQPTTSSNDVDDSVDLQQIKTASIEVAQIEAEIDEKSDQQQLPISTVVETEMEVDNNEPANDDDEEDNNQNENNSQLDEEEQIQNEDEEYESSDVYDEDDDEEDEDEEDDEDGEITDEMEDSQQHYQYMQHHPNDEEYDDNDSQSDQLDKFKGSDDVIILDEDDEDEDQPAAQDDNTKDRTENEEISNQNPNEEEGNQAAGALQFLMHDEYESQQQSNQLDETELSNQQKIDSFNQQTLDMQSFTSLSKAIPFSIEKDPSIDTNLLISEQQQQSDQNEANVEANENEQQPAFQLIYQDENSKDMTILQTTAQQEQSDISRIQNLPNMTISVVSSSQSQSNVDQAPTTSSSSNDQPGNTRKAKLKRPAITTIAITKTASGQQQKKDKQNE